MTRTITGRTVSEPSGNVIPGATIEPVGHGPVSSGPDGMFAVDVGTDSSVRVAGKAAGHVDHENVLLGSPELATLRLISLAPPFDLEVYRQIARKAYDDPSALRPITRHVVQPRFYLSTTLEDGTTYIPQDEIDRVISLVQATFPQATGGVFNAQSFTTGTEKVNGSSATGIVAIEVRTDATSNGIPVCGLANLFSITLQYGNRPGATCICDKSHIIQPDTVIHETAHAAGLFHHSGLGVLNPTNPCSARLSLTGLSDEEKFYAQIIYSRPQGNTDPDIDPLARTSLTTVSGRAMEP